MEKLLFITSQLPYPPYKGGVSTSWNFIRYLSGHFQTSMITLLKLEDPNFEQEFLSKVKLEKYHSHELNIGRKAGTVLKSYMKGVPINLVRNYDRHLEIIIHKWLETDYYDFVFVDHYEMFQYIPEKIKSHTIMHEHNAEFVMWQRYSEISNNPVKKLLTYLESRRIRKIEKTYCERADMVLANPNDQQVLQSLANKSSRIEQIIPCGEDFMLDWSSLEWEETEPSILYIGSLNWEANIDGLVWFIEEGWESLKKQSPEVKFYIVGNNPDNRIVELAKKYPGIILTGFVEDLEEYYTKCRVFITPLRFGSGIKIKVMNAMFRGLPVVTTPIGSEGMPVENGVHLYHNMEMDAFVSSTTTLLNERKIWEQFRDNSRQLTATHFSWNTQLANIKSNILSLNGELIQEKQIGK